MLSTPVALSVFNRPSTTERVFKAIAQARPRQLFVFADGPRSPDDARLCAHALAVVDNVDWECDVRYDVSAQNLGARRRYASGVDWVFSHVDEAIILDDDCLPDPTFFPFCEAMLERHRDDPRVMMVCGTNYLQRWKDDQQSYHFSHFGSVWGWATWKRAWELYDVEMKRWADAEVKQRIRDLLDDDEVFESQARRFDRLTADTEDRHSWDLPWSLARLAHGGLTVVPAVSLVVNLGNADGRGLPLDHPLATIPVAPMRFPLQEPAAVAVDREYDKLHIRRIFEWWEHQSELREQSRLRSRSAHRRVARKLGRAFSRLIHGASRVVDG